VLRLRSPCISDFSVRVFFNGRQYRAFRLFALHFNRVSYPLQSLPLVRNYLVKFEEQLQA
jgi:hypothetical protein